MRLEARIERGETDGVRVALSGVIDERAELQSIFERIEADATFDLADVSRINSPGVLRWISAMREFTAQFKAAIERVSYPMALQAICLKNMFPGADVRSCLAPYFCESCGKSLQILVTAEEVSSDQAPPRKECPDCGSELDFDELDAYFVVLAPAPT